MLQRFRCTVGSKNVRKTSTGLSKTGSSDGSRLSRRLAIIHMFALIGLIAAFVVGILWIADEHDDLARASTSQMVNSGLNAIIAKPKNMVVDYSIWTEAYDAVQQQDVDWLYRNSGTAASDIGTLDLIVFLDLATGFDVGWKAGSPSGGELGLIPADVRRSVIELASQEPIDVKEARTTFAQFDGATWVLAVARVVPTHGAPETGVETAPLQIHGLRLSSGLLKADIGERYLVEDIRIAGKDTEADDAQILSDWRGEVLGKIVWTPPTPGQEILDRVSVPFAAAVVIVAGIGILLSVIAFRSARHLEDALLQARAGDRAKTEFVANLSHELRTPMNAVIGVTELLLGQNPTPKQKSLLDIQLDSAMHQVNLIEDLLLLTESDAGRRQNPPKELVIAQVIDDVLNSLDRKISEKSLSIKKEIDDLSNRKVIGDEKSIRQIITNLVDNAIKFTDAGVITISSSVNMKDNKADCRISVRDTGIGISEDNQAKVFDRFFQVDSSTDRMSGGSGLGLAISAFLANSLRGTLEVESEPGRGSCFTLEIPLEVAHAPAARLVAAAE